MSSTASVGGSNSAYVSSTSRKADRVIARADQNGDKQISLSEFNSIGQNLPGSSASSAASTTSTPATSASAASPASVADRSALFGKIDTNADGQLSKDELSAYQQQQVTATRGALLNLQEVFGDGSDSGGQAGGVGQARRGHHHHATQASTTDGSDVTGQSSATASSTGNPTDPVSAFFSAVDGNSDGSISKAELSSFVTRMFSRLGSAKAGASMASAGTTA